MAQSKLGAAKAARTLRRKYGRDYFHRIGKSGGSKGKTGGFHHMMINGQMDKLRAASAAGGRTSRRGPEKSWQT